VSILKRNRNADAVPADGFDFAAVKSIVARGTAGMPDGALRLDAARLSDDDRDELIGLARQGWVDGTFQIGRLGAKAARFEHLVENAAGKPGLFIADRKADNDRAEFARIGREARRPRPRVRYEEEGSICIPQNVWRDLSRVGPAYTISTLGVLCLVLFALENGEPPETMPRAAMDGVGDAAALVLDVRYGFGGTLDDGLEVGEWKYAVEHLADVGWFALDKQGQTWRISRGPRALQAAKRAA
jgi:hypothetical protein